MPKLHHHIALKPLHTFGIDVYADSYFPFSENEELQSLISSGQIQPYQPIILGGGSNFLPVGDIHQLIIHPQKKGIRVINETADHVWVEAFAGEVWDDLVAYCVSNGFYGLENLSLIPGNVGASPVQNVGAYGVEAGDCIEFVDAIDLKTAAIRQFSKLECQFGYRHSIFKEDGFKNQVVIIRVVFKLSKQPVFHLDYGNIRQELEKEDGISLANIRKVVIRIRTSKLPDPAVIGNAGSFFKNPVIAIELAEQIKSKYPNVPFYPVDASLVKLPAGWLIETAGWKGRQMGRAGVHPLQALVLTNMGGASGDEIISLANAIEKDVFAKFNVRLEKEVNIIG
jgi:UDP-N-acetylmuramate dehydrogenase